MKNLIKHMTILVLISVMVSSCDNNVTWIKSPDIITTETTSSIISNTVEPLYYYCANSRINLITDNISPLCIDPLCSHNTAECKLYGLINSYVIDNKLVYFICNDFKNNTETQKLNIYLKKYNIETDKTVVINGLPDQGTSIFIKNSDSLYLWNISYINDATQKSQTYEYCVYKIDEVKDTSEIIYKKQFNDYTKYIIAIKNNKIYWSDKLAAEPKKYYSTDLNGDNTIYIDFYKFYEIIKAKAGYLFYTQDSNNIKGWSEGTLYLYEYSNSGITEVDTDVIRFGFTDKYIYYAKSENGKTNLYRANNITLKPELICELTSYNALAYDFTGITDVGDYTGCCFYYIHSVYGASPDKYLIFTVNNKNMEYKIFQN